MLNTERDLERKGAVKNVGRSGWGLEFTLDTYKAIIADLNLSGSNAVVSGSIVGTDLVLILEDGNTVTIDVSATLDTPTKAQAAAFTDSIQDITLGVQATTFRTTEALELTEVRIDVRDAATGADLEVDVLANGVSIFSTNITIDDGDTTSVGATVPYVLSTTSIPDNAEISVDVIVVGSTTAGVGLHLALIQA